MKVAFLADIHGNAPALEAVLSQLPAVDLIVCCGDVIGYYPDVNEVCERLRVPGVAVIRGNHDAYVTGGLEPDPRKVAAYRTQWTRSHLSEDHLTWLAALPVELRFEWSGGPVVVRHASPWDEETYLYPDSPRLAEVNLPEHETLVLGHTHHPMWKQAGRGWILNPGSVGQPRDWDPRASYAVADTATGAFELKRAPYDVPGLQKRLRSMGWDDDLLRILSREKA